MTLTSKHLKGIPWGLKYLGYMGILYLTVITYYSIRFIQWHIVYSKDESIVHKSNSKILI